MRKNSVKNIRINQEVQKELSIIIQRELKDPRIDPLASVSDVEVAPDLKTAKVYISVLGDESKKKSTMAGIKNAAAFLRSQLARRLNLRNTPELRFILDDSVEYGMKIESLLDSCNIRYDEDEVLDEAEDAMDVFDEEE